MTWVEFTSQIERLSSTFGKNAYGEERVKLLWQEISDFSSFWFKRTVDRFISEFRQTPLLPEFREEISKERELQWKTQKEQNRKEAQRFFDGRFSNDDVSHICKTIGKRLRGEIGDEDYKKFIEHLEHASNNSGQVVSIGCEECEGRGLVFHRDHENYEWIYRCYCSHGDKQPKTYALFKKSMSGGNKQ